MPDILVRQIDRGFWARARDAADLKRGSAADGSQNVLYSRGTIKTPFGFDKVESGSLPLDSGNPVIGMYPYTELDKTQHFLAVTFDTIQERDTPSSEWDDLTQSGVPFGANIHNPVSFSSILHTDGLKLNGTGDDWFHHCLVSNGGVTAVQRWAGKFETYFADLEGADGYHDAGSGRTTHFASQVISFYNHVILMNPKIANAANNLVENNQRLQWSAAGKLELWSGQTSGNTNLVDTGGYNMWMAHLGNQLICYQNNSIYSLNHIGGSDVFANRLEMPDLGLLAPHLVHSKRNVHYFLGNDYNLYRYYGGANTEIISRGIQRYLERDLDPAYQNRCWLSMGAENSRLWLFIVPNGSEYITQAYGIDMVTGKWMKRDYLHKWATGGITSIALIGASTTESGQSYAELLATGKTYSDLVTEGTTYRQLVQSTLTKEQLALGDSRGYVYQYDSDATQDDGVNIPSDHLTEVSDAGKPAKSKLWPGIYITAKGTNITVSYRTTSFETIDNGWNLLNTPNNHDWIGIGSSNLSSHCGDTSPAPWDLASALDGVGQWLHSEDEVHYFILDLGENYLLEKFKARSSSARDPIDVDIFVSEDGSTWGDAVVVGITTWQDTTSFVEVNATNKIGRYIKVVVNAVEDVFGRIAWGASPVFSIFDAYGAPINLTSEFEDYFFVVNDTSKKIQFKFHHTADDWSVSNYVIQEPQLQGDI